MSGIYFKELWGEIATIKGKHEDVYEYFRIQLVLLNKLYFINRELFHDPLSICD